MTMKLGSYEHKKLFCRMLIDTHATDNPQKFPWPKLDDQSLARLQSISVWPTLLHHQQQGSHVLGAYAESVRDPLMKEVIALLALEQDRQTQALTAMMDEYGVPQSGAVSLQPSNNPEKDFINFGFTHCLDSFLGFGLFEVLQQAHYLPVSLLDRFNIALDEKARHLVFFINWWAYWNLKIKHRKAWSELRGLGAFWTRSRNLLSLMSACDQEDFDEGTSALFSADLLMGELTKDQFLSICRLAQSHRMQHFDPNLLKPKFPDIGAEVIQRVLKFWPQRVGS